MILLRRITAFLTLALILGSMGWSIAEKEATLSEGRTILLRMAPVDPRSLIQGDYMTIGYHEKLFPDPEIVEQLPYKGLAILTLDAQSEATFVRIDDGSPIEKSEIRVKYRRVQLGWRGTGMKYAANSYFFEEGQAERFENAQFVIVTVGPNGETVLTGLADEDGVRIPTG